MNVTHYIGFDVHKKHINFCIKGGNDEVVEEGRLMAERSALRWWAGTQTYRWHGAMEATLFSGWIFDTLKPYAAQLDMAHPAMLKAIAAAKKKNDRIDARHYRRPGALQPAAGLPCGFAGDTQTAPFAALSQSGGARIGAHAKQNGWAADGVRHSVYWTNSRRCRIR